VGAQFGVVLVRQRRRWIEVATFRSDGPYFDGRHPTRVTFSDARQDAQRRDFTVNGMFLDPLGHRIIDYVGGRVDLDRRLIRCIGAAGDRFEEDHLRLLRAVRFASRLGFEIEERTFSAMREHAPKLVRMAAERIRDELEKMLAPATRVAALDLMERAGLLSYLWEGATWTSAQVMQARTLLRRLRGEVALELGLAGLLSDRRSERVNAICRALSCSNEQREGIVWLVEHQADLDSPEALSLAEVKRLMAHRGFGWLRAWAEARCCGRPDHDECVAALERRLSAIRPETVQPPPLVTGDDLIARGVAPGPIYKDVLDELYTRQLDETLDTRDAALRALDGLLAEREAT